MVPASLQNKIDIEANLVNIFAFLKQQCFNEREDQRSLTKTGRYRKAKRIGTTNTNT
jgi:hypothetical protein